MALFATRRTLATLLNRTLASPSRARLTVPLLNLHDPIQQPAPNPYNKLLTRNKTSGSGYSPLNDPSPNWSNRPPKETILLDGCDYEHWLIVMEFPNDPKPSDEEMVNSYVKTLASVVGSEEEAKKKIYSVCTSTYTGFGALISEELSYKVKGLPGVLWVLPDSYLDVPNKDYGGDLFVDGKVIPRPQYRFSERQPTRNRPRPRYDRRRETMQVQRREPMQRESWSPNHQGPPQQTMPPNGWSQNQQGAPQQPTPMNSWSPNQQGPPQQPRQTNGWSPNQQGPPQQPTQMNGWSPNQQGPPQQPTPMNGWSPNQQGPPQQPAPVNSQNVPQGGEGGYQANQSGLHGNNA